MCLSPLSFLSGFYSPQEASVLNHSGEEEVNKKALENSCVWFIGTQDNRQKTREGRTDHHHPTKKKCVSAPAGSSRIVRPHWYAIACCREVGYFFFFFLTHCRNATLVVASPIWKIMKTHPLCLLPFFSVSLSLTQNTLGSRRHFKVVPCVNNKEVYKRQGKREASLLLFFLLRH